MTENSPNPGKGKVGLEQYDPKEIEPPWISKWEERVSKEKGGNFRGRFSILMPPPNVTGALHMGHALNNTIQDLLIRYYRLMDYEVLWQPGTDHAGIATQNIVERDLLKKGIDRFSLPPEEFVAKIWEWVHQYGNRIVEQLKRLGSSCRWDRLRFTLDPGFSKAVRYAFHTLYREGLIYKGEYLVNFCPRCGTALSDLEVNHKEVEGILAKIHYPLDGGGDGVVVTTTRPETMLGDTGVAVHPEDPRYSSLIGKKVVLPLVGRKIPIIGDTRVSPEFGTGVLKVTPAHDFTDFEIGNDHSLPRISIFTKEGIVVEGYEPFSGMDRFSARKAILSHLQEKGYLQGVESYTHMVGHCYRCGTIVEPYLSQQWFVKTRPLAEKVLQYVREGRFRFFPEGYKSLFVQWLENIRDWCISRQILWGHPIPVFTCKNCQYTDLYDDPPSRCPQCKGEVELEKDVLDTWFSSALWPLGTLGFPENTEDLQKWYPTSALVTAFDILFFWVARMAMMGIHFQGDVPFRDIVLHALVRDEMGVKMSKTKGNVVDPLELIDRYGADALRFTLVSLTAIGRDILLNEKRIEGYRRFANKVWNAGRYLLLTIPEEDLRKDLLRKPSYPLKHPLNRWIFHEITTTWEGIQSAVSQYELHRYAQMVYSLIWDRFCDWYLEGSKLLVKDPVFQKETQWTLFQSFRILLHLLHPLMPFLTEELHFHLFSSSTLLMESSFSSLPFSKDPVSYGIFTEIEKAVRGVRRIRSEHLIPPQKKVTVFFHAEENSPLRDPVSLSLFKYLAGVEEVQEISPFSAPPFSGVYTGSSFLLWVPLKDLIDLKKEIDRLSRELARKENRLYELQSRLQDPRFREKVDPDQLREEEERYKEEMEVVMRLREVLERFKKVEL